MIPFPDKFRTLSFLLSLQFLLLLTMKIVHQLGLVHFTSCIYPHFLSLSYHALRPSRLIPHFYLYFVHVESVAMFTLVYPPLDTYVI